MAAISMRRPARRVRVRVHTDKPIVSGNMLFAQARDGVEGAGSVLRPIGDQVLEGELIWRETTRIASASPIAMA